MEKSTTLMSLAKMSRNGLSRRHHHPYRFKAYYCCLLLVIISVLLLSIQSELKLSRATRDINDQRIENNLALKDHLLRFKRQTGGGSNGPQESTATRPNQPQGSSGGGGGGSSMPDGQNNPQDASDQDDKPVIETLSSLKCDFGTADSPDLCKFRVLETNSPLSRVLPAWTHGSPKLALYQGGPLMDASGANDTSGGYVFYETSNPYASTNHSIPAGSAGAHSGAFGSSAHAFDTMMKTTNVNHHHDHHNGMSDSMTALLKSSSSHRTIGPELHPQSGSSDSHSNFQQVTSARVVIGENTLGAAFISPNLTAPGPAGMCLSFQYAIQGLSAEELRVHVLDHRTDRSRQIWASSESAGSNWTRGEVLYSVTNKHSIVFTASGSSSHAAKDLQQRKFRGYIALDEVEINKHDSTGGGEGGACKGHCNFDGDLCGWTNAENGQEDDFDWTLGRGSDNLFTGPQRDFVSSTNNELTGSYLFTDSGYPRRPGDRAIMMSPMFQPTAVNEAMCMRFAVHMFGSGIGSLAIKIRFADESAAPTKATSSPDQSGGATASQQPGAAARSSDGKSNNLDLVIWEMSGDAGNSWHQAQTSVSSAKSQFQVLIEGVVGENNLGNMAIDEISFSSGPCPTSPPIASKNYGDCTFEQSMCYWRNPDEEIHLDDLDWIRSADEQSIHGPNFDHTLKKKSGSYLKLENTFREPKSGTRAFLLSPIFQPKTQGNVQCLSFYYYMFMRSIGSSGPNLGTIRVYLASNNELVPIWRLTNPISSPNWKHARASLSASMVDGQPVAPTKLFQIAFEGIWGDAQGGAIAIDDVTVFDGACDIMPMEAKSVPGECTFDVDMCSWFNKTSDIISIMDSAIDSDRSPFLQSVNSATAGAHASNSRLMPGGGPNGKRGISWQLATVDSRPVNLQDHTYKAPIGYVYVDVLDGGSERVRFPLQGSEVTVQSGQQVTQCLSFWFAVYGRQETNQLNVYLTQASAPPPESDGGSSAAAAAGTPQGASPIRGGSQSNAAGTTGSNSQPGGSATSNNSPATPAGSENDQENSQAWKFIDGKLIWSISLRNITESSRRKWLYGQVSLKADSNHIVRFIALSNDGGFALDDISYYDGLCETRPAMAKIQSEDDSNDSSQPPATSKT